MRLIDGDALANAMYHEAFETDSDMQKWDSGCWIRYKMFEKHLANAPTIPQWIPVKWHYITDEEREENGYPKDWVCYLDCEMPEDEQEILVTTNHGRVEKDVCYLDDGFSLDSGWDWIEDIVAWMPLPESYKGGGE